jgi:hypothetical protein
MRTAGRRLDLIFCCPINACEINSRSVRDAFPQAQGVFLSVGQSATCSRGSFGPLASEPIIYAGRLAIVKAVPLLTETSS